jgi:hypothetical protein
MKAMDLLYAMRDLGVDAPAVDDVGDQRARAALTREIEHATEPDTPTGWARVLRRRGPNTRGLRGRGRVVALAAAGVVVVGSGIAVATVYFNPASVQVASPAQVFADNPADWNQDNLPNSNTPIAAGSVKQLGTISVPGVGTFEYWGARTTDGEWCAAFRAPDGTWAGTTGGYATDNIQPNYSFGGDVPGCGVLPTQAPQPDSKTPPSPGEFGFNMQGGGFYFSTDSIGPIASGARDASNEWSWIVYGIIDNPGATTRVVDANSGASTPILADGTFALVLPGLDPPVRLEAVDGSGNVISQAYPFGGNYPLAPAVLAYREERLRFNGYPLAAAQMARQEQRRLNAARTARTRQARSRASQRPIG